MLLVCDHNPFYLLSGVCLLGGKYLISDAGHEVQDSLGVVVGLLAAFTVYELFVFVLAGWLLRRHGQVRNTGWLLGLAVLLLADVTFVYQEALTMAGWSGVGLAVIAIGLGLGKVEWAAWVSGVRLRRVDRAVLAAAVIALFTLPIAMRQAKLAEVMGPWAMYAAWWAVGALVCAWGATLRSGRVRVSARSRRLARGLSAWLLAVPVVSLGAHVAVLHWVYEVEWGMVMAGPVALGAAGAVVLARRPTASVGGVAWVAWGAAAIAAMVSASPPSRLGLEAWEWLTPWRCIGAAAAGLALLAGVRRGVWAASVPLGALAVGGVIGPDGRVASDRLATAIRWAVEIVRDLVPRSAMTWGLMAMAWSFVLLGLGAVFSWAGARLRRAGG
ncbi:MAG: hypothetical protein AAF078_01735 [Planctomycetota bacterium]